MSQTPTTPSTSSGSTMPTLAAPMMSASSSTASHSTKMWSAEASRRGSNASSVAPAIEAPEAKKTEPASAPARAAAPAAAPAPRPLLVKRQDPMSRVYAKPEAEINVDEALNREPLPWSLGHWRKHARDVREVNLPRDVAQQRFQDTKADLLRSFAAMQIPKK